MKKASFIVLFAIYKVLLFSCSSEPTGEQLYYNIFLQTNISDPEYLSFIRYFKFPEGFHSNFREGNEGNIGLWKKYFDEPYWNEKAIKSILKENGSYIWKNRINSKEINAKKYINFALKCSSNFEVPNSWDYNEIKLKGQKNISELIDQGYKFFNQEEELSLKLRYGYQIIRLLRYSEQYKGAIEFFNKNIEKNFEKNEIFYYILDQIAGCHYNIREFEMAAYLFLKVFDKSRDKKRSAYISYTFCTNSNAEGKKYFKDENDKIAFLTLKYLRSFSDDIKGLEEFYNFKPEDQRFELIFMRIFNKLETQVFPTKYGEWKDQLPFVDSNLKAKIEKMLSYANGNIQNPKVKHKEFWYLSSSYLNFLDGNKDEANNVLKNVKSKKYAEQIKIFKNVYKCLSWTNMNDQNDTELSTIIPYSEEQFHDYKYFVSGPRWRQLILSYISHLYLKERKFAKSFLIFNNLGDMDRLYSLDLIEDMIKFLSKPNKNPFESILFNFCNSNDKDPLEYTRRLMANYFLMHGKPASALEVLKKVRVLRHDDSYNLPTMFDSRIFSNNISEVYGNRGYLNISIMKDSVYLSKIFKFIPGEMNLKELAVCLIKLDSMTKDSKRSTRKLANYLLGNYYFNISNTGAFKSVFIYYEPQTAHGIYFYSEYENERENAESLIKNKKIYNMRDINENFKMYFGLEKSATKYYQEALLNSDDKELNARIVYMMAKCELNTMYNENREFSNEYDGTLNSKTLKYKTNFNRLKNDYSETKFYKKIIRECSFFRYYCES